MASFRLATVGTFFALCARGCNICFCNFELRLKIARLRVQNCVLRYKNLVLRKRLLGLSVESSKLLLQESDALVLDETRCDVPK